MIFLDLETTGFDCEKDKIIEFAAVKTDDNYQVLEQLDFLINPEIEIPPQVSYVTKIYNQDVKNQAKITEHVEKIKQFIQDDIIVGHNIAFDLDFLKKYQIALNNDSLDTCALAALAFSQDESYSLEILSDKFKIEHQYKHRALGDVLACIDLMKIIHQFINQFPLEFFKKVQELEQKTKHTLFSQILFFQKKPNYQFNITNKNAAYFIPKLNNKLKIPSENTLIQVKKFSTALTFIQQFQGEILAVKPNLIEFFINFLQKKKKKFSYIFPITEYACLQKVKRFKSKTEYSTTEVFLLLKILRNQFLKKEIRKSLLNLQGDEFKIWADLFLDLEDYQNKLKESYQTEYLFLTPFENIFKRYLSLNSLNQILFFDLQENDLDQMFTEKFSEKVLLTKIISLDLKEVLIKFLQKIKAFILKDETEIDRFGKYFILSPDLMIDFSTLQKEGQKIAQQLSLLNYLTKNIINSFCKFFSSDVAIRFIYLTKKKDLTCYVYPYSYTELLPNNLLKQISFLSFNHFLTNKFSLLEQIFNYSTKKELVSDNWDINLQLPDPNFPGPKNPNYEQAIKEKIIDTVNISEKRICILCSSKAQLEKLFLFLSSQNLNNRLCLATGFSGGIKKIQYLLEKNSNSVFLTCLPVSELFLLNNIFFETVILPKLPFVSTFHPLAKERSNCYSNSFTEYVIPRSVLLLKRSLHWLLFKNLYILDNTIKNNWAKEFIKNLLF